MAFKPRPIEAKKAIEPKKPIRAFVATPAYDGRVLTDYAVSISESSLIAPMFGIHVTTSIMGNGAFIDIARNTFVKLFLESDCTHLFFIDADLKWEARAFVSLLQADLPICAGVYPKRQTPEEFPVRFIAKDGIPWVTATGDPDSGPADSGWVQCERVPGGFLCIRRDTIEYMVARSPQQMESRGGKQPLLFAGAHFKRLSPTEYGPVDIINGEFTPEDFVDFLGEDYYFCDRYIRMTGKSIPVWADFDFCHAVNWTGNWHQYLIKQSDVEGTKKAEALAKQVEEDKRRVA
jgi:hypothetical protein